MEHIWRLLVAIFLLCMVMVFGMLVYMFQGTVIAGLAVYAMLFLVLWGIGAGIIAIIDHNRENKE